MMHRKVAIWWHVATINNWRDVFAEQVGKLVCTGLYDRAEIIWVGKVGTELIPMFPLTKMQIADAHNDPKKYEILTIQAMDAWVRQLKKPEEWAVFYLHCKGVGRQDIESQFNVSFWRRYMEWATIQKWSKCLRALDGCDACGVDLNLNPWPHFAGNFWWARAEYLLTLPPATTLTTDDPVRAELRIGESNRAMSLHQLWNSGLNLYETKYLPENYINKQVLMPQGCEYDV